jgi:uncharacterized membrane protein YkoI
METIAAVIAIFVGGIIAATPAHSEHVEANKEEVIKIANPDENNAKLHECIKTALERHAGAVIEVEAENEDDKTIIEVDIQGKDGKNWEVKCDAVTGEVLEDKEDSDEKEEDEKENK